MRNLLNVLEVDRAVSLALAHRFWTLFAGPITLLMISLHLTSEVQGYYYAFFSLQTMQLLVELSLSVAVLQCASHEWAFLSLDSKRTPAGPPEALSRLASLVRQAGAWYGRAGVVFPIVLATAGWVFFEWKGETRVAWSGPLLLFALFCGLELALLPYVTVLEGCNQVAAVNAFRFLRNFTANVILWTALFLGGSLWAAALSVGAGQCVLMLLVGIRYREFFRELAASAGPTVIDWRREIRPMQSRLAVGSIAGFAGFSLFTPIVFWHHGAVEAGRIGMTLHVTAVIQSFALTWLTSRTPRFGMSVARKDWDALDTQLVRVSSIATGIAALLSLLFWFLVAALYSFDFPMAGRLLSPIPTAVFLVTAVLGMVSQSLSIFCRAHKKEPFAGLIVATSVLSLGGAWFLGATWGAFGTAVALFVATIFCLSFQIPMTLAYRRLWRAAEIPGE